MSGFLMSGKWRGVTAKPGPRRVHGPARCGGGAARGRVQPCDGRGVAAAPGAATDAPRVLSPGRSWPGTTPASSRRCPPAPAPASRPAGRAPRQQRAGVVVLTTAPVRCCRCGGRRSDSNGPWVRRLWSERVGLGQRLCRAGRPVITADDCRVRGGGSACSGGSAGLPRRIVVRGAEDYGVTESYRRYPAGILRDAQILRGAHQKAP